MILFPHAKINLGLNVIARLADSYHEIESVLIPIPLTDVLEAVIDPDLGENELIYDRTGLPIPGTVEGDLCYKAVRMLQEITPLPGIRLHLHKVIPMGAGLGGGSSDGAHTLLLLKDLCQLPLDGDLLHSLASRLGSDCPFFLRPNAQLALGRGELLEPIALDLSGLWLMVVYPAVHVSTGEVYTNTTPTGQPWDLGALLVRERISNWGSTVRNVMETYVLEAYPAVAEVKRLLLDQGAVYACMSGSGSTVFGLFTSRPVLPSLPLDHRSWVFEL